MKDFQAFLSFEGFPFFQMISDYFVPCFPGSFTWVTTTNVEGFTFTRPNTLFHLL